MKFSVLASGSSGNSTAVAAGKDCILVDAGISCRATREAMSTSFSRELEDVRAIILTHEHTDHAKGVVQIVKENPQITLYLSAKTWQQLVEDEKTGRRKELRGIADVKRIEIFDTGSPFQVGGLVVTPFPVMHDAADPCGFLIDYQGLRLTVATDLGQMTPTVAAAVNSSMAVLMESNYDPQMLEQEMTRPEFAKRRVASAMGHLSNYQVEDFLRTDFNGAPLHLILGHVSRETNIDTLPGILAAGALAQRGFDWVKVQTAIQGSPLREIRL